MYAMCAVAVVMDSLKSATQNLRTTESHVQETYVILNVIMLPARRHCFCQGSRSSRIRTRQKNEVDLKDLSTNQRQHLRYNQILMKRIMSAGEGQNYAVFFSRNNFKLQISFLCCLQIRIFTSIVCIANLRPGYQSFC